MDNHTTYHTDNHTTYHIGMPNFVLPNLDSVNHCTSKEISMEIKRYLLAQWLTESRFGKTKFGIPIEKRSLMSAGIGCNRGVSAVSRCAADLEWHPSECSHAGGKKMMWQ